MEFLGVKKFEHVLSCCMLLEVLSSISSQFFLVVIDLTGEVHRSDRCVVQVLG
jgi:hypothetical protein